MVKEVVIIGAGIIGATVAEALRKNGQDVLLIDSESRFSGTRPSGGHLRESWFGKVPKETYKPALELLDEVWGIHTARFMVYPKKQFAEVGRVDIDKVMKTRKLKALVTGINYESGFPEVTYIDKFAKATVQCRHLIIAAGVSSQELYPDMPKITGKWGVSFRLPMQVKVPFIKPWAPYKQIVAHNQTDKEIWIGDGSSLVEKSWSESRIGECLERCTDAVKCTKAPLKTLEGVRPYCAHDEKEPCLLVRDGRVWVATGSAKLGTIAAGWVANQFLSQKG